MEFQLISIVSISKLVQIFSHTYFFQANGSVFLSIMQSNFFFFLRIQTISHTQKKIRCSFEISQTS